MIRTGIGVARGGDATEVGRRVAARARAECPAPKAALLFADSSYEAEALLAAIRESLGDVPVWGTTSPRLVSTAGPAAGGAVLLLVDGDGLEFRLLAGRVKGAPRDAARYLAAKYLHERPVTAADRVACLLVGTESHLRGVDYLRGLADVFPFPPAVVGGSSVGRFPYARLEELHAGAQYCGSYAGTDHLSLLFVRALDPARVRFAFAYESRFPPVTPPVVCTKAEGAAVFEVDGIPIVDYAKRFFGAGFATSINQIKERYTFASLIADGRGTERSVFRAQNFDFARGCAIFWPDEEMAGRSIQLVHTTRAEVIESAGRGAASVRAALAGADPAFALAFDCVGRSRLLLSRADEEIEHLVEGLGRGVPVAGFYTAGEFAPFLDRYESIVDRTNPLCGSGQFGCTLSLFSVAEAEAPAPAPADLRDRLAAEAGADEPCDEPGCAARRTARLEAELETAERTLTETEATLSLISGELSATLLAERARRAELAEAHAANERLMGLLRRYTPRTVLEKAAVSVRAGLLDIPDEELHLAFLFMDIKGFTSYSETRPPDEVIAAINGLLGPATESVHRHGGDVDKYIGDCLFATFPSCDAALAAALEMQRQVAAHRRNGSPFDARIGLNWGRVVSGNVGGVERCDNTLIGDAVNLAQRLESNCAPGKVLVSAAFFAKVSATAKQGLADRPGRIEVKGKAAPIDVVELDPHAPPTAGPPGGA